VRLGQWLGYSCLSLYSVANTCKFFSICSCSFATVLNRVVLLQRYRIKRGHCHHSCCVTGSRHWLLCSDCATHRAVATIVQLFILPQVSTRLRAWFDWLQSVIPVPLEQFRAVGISSTTSNLGSSAAEQLLSYSITRLPLSLACCCSWFWPSCSWWILPIPRVFVLAFPASIVGELGDSFECENSLVGWIRGTL